jgi:hypothetical protein
MATENAGRRERDIKEDPLVAALVPDPAKLPVNAAVLAGFVGKSLDEGSWRLYLDAGLTEYVEIPETEILYARELPGGAGTAVWVPATLTLDRVRVAATQIQAEFLSGTIAARGLPAAVQALGPQGEFIWPSSLGGCRPHGMSIDSPCLQVQRPGQVAGFLIPGIGPDVTAFCPPGLLPVPHPHFPK